MELQHINIKVMAAGPAEIELPAFTPVFHGWIQEQNFAELLIDVADYSHVPAGPGIVLIGHQADYSMDCAGGRLGLRYNRKQKLDGSNLDRFRQSARAALQACALLEKNPPVKQLRFNAGDMELFINDRALAPNTPATRSACEEELRQFFKQLFGPADCTVEFEKDPRRRFGVRVQAASGGTREIPALLGRL